jgi:hypothetical protein
LKRHDQNVSNLDLNNIPSDPRRLKNSKRKKNEENHTKVQHNKIDEIQ